MPFWKVSTRLKGNRQMMSQNRFLLNSHSLEHSPESKALYEAGKDSELKSSVSDLLCSKDSE